MNSIDVDDLIGTRYLRGGTDPKFGLDCRTLCFLAAARIPLVGVPEPHEAEDASYAWVLDGVSPWCRIGGEVTVARKVGHLVLTDTNDAEAGVLILVNKRERLFLTTNARRGHAFLIPSRAVRDVVGVFEWGGVA